MKKASEGEKFCECLTQTEAKTKPESQQNHKTSQKIASNCLEYFLEICEQRKFFSADSAKNTASDTDKRLSDQLELQLSDNHGF